MITSFPVHVSGNKFAWDDDLQFESAKELKTLTSKNVHLLLRSQKFCALTSNRASSSIFALLIRNVSPDNGWKGGSISTLGQTSLRN